MHRTAMRYGVTRNACMMTWARILTGVELSGIRMQAHAPERLAQRNREHDHEGAISASCAAARNASSTSRQACAAALSDRRHVWPPLTHQLRASPEAGPGERQRETSLPEKSCCTGFDRVRVVPLLLGCRVQPQRVPDKVRASSPRATPRPARRSCARRCRRPA